MARQRMYLFERAYVDYAQRFRGSGDRLKEVCSDIWTWFWSGPAATFFEVLLRIAIGVVAVALCVMYVRYELAHGRSVSLSTISVLGVIMLVATLVLWGWKAPFHLGARAVSALCASSLVAVIGLTTIVVAAVIFFIYLMALCVLTALSFLVFLPMRGAQEAWLLYRKVHYRCPYADCPGKKLPIHICSCGQQYPDLLPSFFGIFHHKCRHGAKDVKLPTMNILGRNKLPRLCSTCKRPLIQSNIGELSDWPIAVVGGVGAGKTLLLLQATRALQEHYKNVPGAAVKIDAPDQQRRFEEQTRLLDNGRVVAQTAGDVVQAFGLAVRVRRERLSRLLYLYDAPGEHFATIQRFGRMQAMRHVKGLILLVDPFSLPALNGHASKAVNPSSDGFNKITANLINTVNMFLATQPGHPCTLPLAVVISKADALPTQAFPFLDGLCPNGVAHSIDTHSPRCREALLRLGEGANIRLLEQHFREVRYFACSALGRVPDGHAGQAFQAHGVLEPFLWLLKRK